MSDINKIREESCTREKGIALITVMLMLAVLTVLSITMANTSIIETHISSNYRTSKEAFYDADAGVHFAMSKIKQQLPANIDLAWVKSTLADLNEELADDQADENSSLYDFTFSFPIDKIKTKETDEYCFTSSAEQASNARAKIKVCFKHERGIDPAFGVGIVSDGNININGAPTITGSLHANGSIVQNGEGTITGNISAVNTVDVDSAVSGATQNNAPYMETPKVTQQLLDNMRTSVLTGEQINPDGYVYYPDTITISDDVQDKVIFVDGNITISNQTKINNNTTIIATGNIIFRGESSFEEGESPDDEGFEIKTAIIAGGDITFNGSGHSYGVFWANGDFVRNGSNYAHGSIVAAGGVDNPDIIFNGKFEFKQITSINNNFIPESIAADFSEWSDLSML